MSSSSGLHHPLFRPTITPEEIQALNETLLDKSTKKTFEQVAASVRSFALADRSRSDTTRFSLSLAILIKQNHVVEQRQLLNAVYCLFDLSRCEPKHHPYLAVFLQRHQSSPSSAERYMISLLLGGLFKEVHRPSSPSDLLSLLD